ncbi:MAG: fasciclin domain-containing protein [Bacteroidales bacterium]|nr:fasciclin domain-containing protein [Bacteroidales bacterium]MCF8404690.1 fasciclin domain-containing protein [Bacteroidales bacterium]
MKSNRIFSILTLAVAGMFFFSSCSKDETTDPMVNTRGQKSIVEIASSSNNFNTLVAALAKADLVSALEGDGPFTVFAPTDDAFNQLFSDLGVNGIEDLSAEALTPILLNHVVAGQASSYELNSGYVATLNTFTPDKMGADVYLEVNGQKSLTRGIDAQTGEIRQKVSQSVMINGMINVVIADIMASNGVIHQIDEIILPSTVVDFAISNPNFSILVEAVVKADLVDALNAEGPYTVFAPTNAAFEKLFSALNVTGIQDLTAETLKPILLYHVLGDNVMASEVAKGSVPTLNTNANIEIDIIDGQVILNGNSAVVATDIQGVNGIIHVIDTVLIP